MESTPVEHHSLWRARLERWLTPIARSIPLSPNAITVLAFVLNIAAAAMLAYARAKPILFVAAVFVIAIAGFLDALDGIVARMRGLATPFGDFLDHLLDRCSDLAILAGWCVGTGLRMPFALAAIVVVALNGYSGTQLEASFGKRAYDSVGRGEFVLALVAFPLIAFALAESHATGNYGGATIPEWLTAILTLFGAFGIVQRVAAGRRMSDSA
jgi:phosphatidylglycerophosphate synthase